jgi:type III secretion protein W
VDHPISRSAPVNLQAIRQLQQMVEEEEIMQVESEDPQDVETSPFAIYQRFQPLQELKAAKKTEEKQAVQEKKILAPEEVDEAAGRFQKNNEELKAKTLLILRSSVTSDDSPEEILNKVMRVYPDHALADEALDFLVETTDGSLEKTLKIAKEELNRTFEREIKAGRNIGVQSREFAKEGLGTPTTLRDMYRDITGNPREALKLFEELTEKFQYDKLKTAITFLLHSLGSDLKSKGPSISRAELVRLIDETRSLQGILGIFRFFQSRMQMMQRQFNSYDLLYPSRLTFEVLAKTFVKMLAERYMNADKVLQFARLLGLSEEAAAQLIIMTQYRDAIKQIAPRYYRNQIHRDELTKAVLEALEKIEDELEEEEEDEK